MSARQNICGFSGMKQIFQADWAVRVESVGLALMIQRSNARAAFVAVHKIIIVFYATNAALVAVVVISLNSVVKEVAHGAKIGGELDAAFIIYACVGHGLSVIALITHHLFHGVPVHFMCLCFIVAVAARILFVATRGHQAASAHIVLAPHQIHVLFFFTVIVTFIVHIWFVLQYKQYIHNTLKCFSQVLLISKQ